MAATAEVGTEEENTFTLNVGNSYMCVGVWVCDWRETDLSGRNMPEELSLYLHMYGLVVL